MLLWTLATAVAAVVVGAVVFVFVYEHTSVPEVDCQDVVLVGVSAACAVPRARLLPGAPLAIGAMITVALASTVIRRKRGSASILQQSNRATVEIE